MHNSSNISQLFYDHLNPKMNRRKKKFTNRNCAIKTSKYSYDVGKSFFYALAMKKTKLGQKSKLQLLLYVCRNGIGMLKLFRYGKNFPKRDQQRQHRLS